MNFHTSLLLRFINCRCMCLVAKLINRYTHTYCMSQNLCHKLFLGIPHPQLSKKVPINMGLKVNRFRDIHCCVEIQEML